MFWVSHTFENRLYLKALNTEKWKGKRKSAEVMTFDKREAGINADYCFYRHLTPLQKSK